MTVPRTSSIRNGTRNTSETQPDSGNRPSPKKSSPTTAPVASANGPTSGRNIGRTRARRATARNTSSGVFSDFLSASFNAGEDWMLSAAASLTLQGRTPAATRSQFGENSSAVTFFTGGADWSVTENLTVGATVDLSPKSTQFAGTPIPLQQSNGRVVIADAQVRSETSQLAAGIDVSWDTLGKSDLEWSLTGGATMVRARAWLSMVEALVRLRRRPS